MKQPTNKQVSSDKPGRLMALEGLRGIAAVAVVLSHLVVAFYPIILDGLMEGRAQHTPFEDNLYGNPVTVVSHGLFAVAIFFVLSGFVLSIGYFRENNLEVIKKLAAKRYFRLAIPATVSVAGVWLLVSLGLYNIEAAGNISTSGWSVWSITPSLPDALYQGLVGSFFEGAHSYNTVLWTMLYEFVGSFMVFALLFVFGGVKRRWLVYVGLSLCILNTWYFPFILGVMLADIYANKQQLFEDKRLLGIVLLAVGVFLGGYPKGVTAGTLYESLPGYQSIYLSFGALLVLIAILLLPKLLRVLEKASILGRYTFSLYLVHIPIIFSLTAGLFVWFVNDLHVSYNLAVLYAVIGSLPVLIAASWLFERYVDSPSITASSKFANWLLQGDKTR